MPTPDISLLDADHLKDYQYAVDTLGRDPQTTFDLYLKDQQSILEAQQFFIKEEETDKALQSGNLEAVPQAVKDVLDIPTLLSKYKPLAEFQPGFAPVIPPLEKQLGTAGKVNKLTDPKNLDKSITDALSVGENYYAQQGFPTAEQQQNDAIRNFIETFGDKQNYIRTNPRQYQSTNEELGKHYDAMFEEAKNPRQSFSPSAANKAFEDIVGSTRDNRVRPNIDAPFQPRRYQQYGDMPKVMPRGEGITELGQGASPVAEDFRKQPDLVREMSLPSLFTEATRPQVVVSGEQVRKDRQAADQIKTRVFDAMMSIMDADDTLSEPAAFDKLTEQYIEQAQVGIRKEIVPRLSAKMLYDYRNGSAQTLFDLGVGPTDEEIIDHMVNAEAKSQVLNFYREANLYEYALRSDILKGSGTYWDRGTNALADAYKYIAQDDQGSEFIQMRKKAGVIDKDAIVEATPMQYARNLNLPFRMIYNPIFDIMGETADLFDGTDIGPDTYNEGDEKAMRTGMDEVKFAEKYGSSLTSPTLDLTDEYSWTSPVKVMDAYFKEVLLETAVGRTVGNDIVSFHPTSYYDRMQSKALNPDEIPFFGDPDTFIVGGTLAEAMVPIEFIPMMMAKVVAKGTRLPANWRTYSQVAKEIEAVAEGTSGAYPLESISKRKQGIMDNSSVAAHAADDTADVILGLERLEDGLPIDEAIKGLGTKGDAVARRMHNRENFSPKMAKDKIEEIAGAPKDYPALHIAAEDSIARRAAYGKDTSDANITRAKARDGTTQNIVAETLAHDSMKGKVAAKLEGEVGLGDYHLLTDRVAVSKKFLSDNPIDGMVADVHKQLGPLLPKDAGPRMIKNDYFKGGANGKPVIEGLEITSKTDGMQVPVNYNLLFQLDRTKDPFLNTIITSIQDGAPITYAQDIYLRQRVLEKVATVKDKGMGLVGDAQRQGSAAIMPIEEGTDFAKMTQVPSERRLDTARAIRSLTPRDVRNALYNMKERLASTMKKTDLQNLGTPDDPAVLALQNSVNEAQVSLQRQIPLVAAKLRKKDGLKDGEVVDAMLAKSLKGEDPTELLTSFGTPEFLVASDAQKKQFYEQLLGPSFNLAENQVAFEKAGGLAKGLSDNDIFQVLQEMKSLVPTSLDTAAVATRTRKGAIVAENVAITDAKIAFMTDQARGIRIQKVIKESQIMEASGVDLALYQKQLANHATPLDADFNELSTELSNLVRDRLIGEQGMGPHPDLRNYTARQKKIHTKLERPAEDMANYLRGKRTGMIAEGYNAEVVNMQFQQNLRSIITDNSSAYLRTPEAQKQLSAIMSDTEAAQKGVAKNLTMLRRPINQGALATLKDLFDYNAAIKSRLISGQLGGMASPNSIYHTQNVITAPLIASITAPDYVGTVIGQQARMIGKAITLRSPSVADDVMMGPQGLSRFITQEIDGAQYIGKYNVEEAMDLYRTKNLGSTQEAMWLDDAFINEVKKQAQGRGIPQRMVDDMIKDIPYSGKITGLPAAERKGQQSVGMLLADSSDRAFREAVFFEALARGKTGDEAAQLAREVLLDFGAMPGIAQETLGKAFLYMSFTYMMGQETLLALADPKKYRVLVGQLNYHRKVSEEMYGQQTELMDKALYKHISNGADGDAYAVFINNPTISAFSQTANITEAVRQFTYGFGVSNERYKELAQEPQVVQAGLSGILDIGYNPFLDMLKTVQMEYKKPLPNKVVYQISAIPSTGPLSGLAVKEFFDMDYVPVERRRKGKAEVGVDRYTIDEATGERRKLSVDELVDENIGGYQLQFKSEKGYAKFVAMQQLLQLSGYGRLLNDTTGALIAGGLLPEGTTFGYDEKSHPIFQMAGGKIVRVPKELEKYDRQVRQHERDLLEFLQGYE
jgi:hypothetical protein